MTLPTTLHASIFAASVPLEAQSAHIPSFEPPHVIIRMGALEGLVGMARPTIYKRIKDDPTFPRPVPLSNSTARGAPVGFVLAEVQQWIQSRIEMREGQ